MNDSKLIAVIILNWNGERLLKEYLPSVVEYSDNKISDIIVVDNGSTDGSIAMLEKISRLLVSCDLTVIMVLRPDIIRLLQR